MEQPPDETALETYNYSPIFFCISATLYTIIQPLMEQPPDQTFLET